MGKIRTILFGGLMFMLSAHAPAQQAVSFTLEDLIPGGKTFYNYYPRIDEQYQWYGNNLVCIRRDSVFIAENAANPEKQTYVFHFNDLRHNLSDNKGSISRLLFDENGSDTVRFFTEKGIGLYDSGKKQQIRFFTFPEKSTNHKLSPDKNYLAYTIDNNLYVADKDGRQTAVSNEENEGIVYGQSVHRDEFGIDRGIFWSPGGEKLGFYRMDETMVTDYPLVDASERVAILKNIKYPMAGMTSHEVTLGVFDTKTGKTVYLKTGIPKDKYLTNMAWSPCGEFIYIAELNRGQNHMKLKRYHAASGDFDRTLFEETHPKYVEPEHPALFVKDDPGRFIWQSERDGYNHLYLYDVSGKLLKQLTKGDWDVTDVIGFDEKGQHLYFVSTDPTPLERRIHSVNLKNGRITRHTIEEGMHSAVVSPSGRYLVDRYPAHNHPGKIDLIDTRTGKTTTLAKAKNPFEGYNMPTVETGTIKAADNSSDLYYRLVKPVDFDPSKKYPVIIYVYGGPHSQMVSNRWRYGSGGWETYMAQKGYIVFVMDNRGTSYRGLEFENVTHRKLGTGEAEDQMKGVEFLKSLPFVDHERLGIHGWSYGGFMTINMLLRYPGVFNAGVAGGPVTDWKYYEIMYGERYMDTPQENPEGYEETSLLNKADNLQDRLLIIHGDEDPTVVMQHSLRFLKACIEAGTHPDCFIYPGHGHNMMGRDRVHLHEHITRYFEDHL